MSLENCPNFVLNLSVRDVNGEEKHYYQFKSFRLNVEERQLFRHNSPVSLTPKAFDVLALLVERSGHLVGKDELLESVWANSFVEEQNITRIVHTLRKTLGEDENGNKFIETVAKKGYRFVAEVEEVSETTAPSSANGKPDSLNFVGNTTALDEFQIPVLEEDENISLPAVEPKQKNRLVLFSVGFLSAIFLILFLSFSFQSDSSDNSKVKSIAVLPIKPISAASRDELYEIGLAESIIHRLSATKSFYVRPLSATRQYTEITQDPVAAGREQKTDYVLASNYQLADGKIRLTAQLFNVATGQIEETYKSEKDAGGVFAMQDAIAGEIGNLLFARFAAVPNKTPAKRGTTNEEAYRLYLQGRNLTMQGNTKKAIEYFEQAIRLDPNYALAFARMANAYLWLDVLDNAVPRAEKIKEIINKALELDTNEAEAYVARGQLNLAFEWNFPAAEKDFLRAIELEPNNDTAHWLYALLLANRGRFDEAITEIETAQAIDPSALRYMMHRGRILYYARRYDEAVVQFERLNDLDENAFSNWNQWAYQMNGDETNAYEIFMKVQKRRKSDHLEIYQKTYETAGWQEVRRKILEFAKLNEQEFPGGAFKIAKEYALLGEKEQAFEYLNKAVENRRWLVSTLNVEPAFDNLRDDPRFDELIERVRLK